MVFFPSKYSAKRRWIRIIFRWRLVITIWYYVPHATVITKHHSNTSAIRHRSEFLMLKCKRQARSELLIFFLALKLQQIRYIKYLLL